MNPDEEKRKTLRDNVFSLKRVKDVEDFEEPEVAAEFQKMRELTREDTSLIPFFLFFSFFFRRNDVIWHISSAEALKLEGGLSDTLMPAHEFVRHIKLYKKGDWDNCYPCQDGMSGSAKYFMFIPVDEEVHRRCVAKSAYLDGYSLKYYTFPVPNQNEFNFPITIDDFYSHPKYPTLLELIINCIEKTVGKFALFHASSSKPVRAPPPLDDDSDDDLDLDNLDSTTMPSNSTTMPSIWKYFVKCCRVDLNKYLHEKKEWVGVLKKSEWDKMKETLINHIENQQNNETLREIFKHRLQLAIESLDTDDQPTEDYDIVKEVEYYWTNKMEENDWTYETVYSLLFDKKDQVWMDNTVKEFNEFIYPYTMVSGVPKLVLTDDWDGSVEFWPNVQHNMCLKGRGFNSFCPRGEEEEEPCWYGMDDDCNFGSINF
jgi:hypothetical protein